MKKIVSLTFAALFILSVIPSCSRRTTIPDNELALIFRDAFLANAYVLDMKTKVDSVQVYQPIFDKYGYSAEDVAYTVGSFSKRKSARLSDVVEQAIKMLTASSEYYKAEAVILDTIDNIARRTARRVIYFDSLVEYHAIADTTGLRIEFDSLAEGDYKISFDYLIDSIDTNRSSYRTQTWAQPYGTTLKKGVTTTNLRKKVEASYDRTISIDTMTHTYVLMLAESFEVKRKPHVTFSNIKVEYTPKTEQAVEELFRKELDIRVFGDEFFDSFQPTDSL